MTSVFSLISSYAYIELPQGIVGWVSFVSLVGMIVFSLWHFRESNQAPSTSGNNVDKRDKLIFLGLLLSVPLTSLFLGFRLPIYPGLPIPGIPHEPYQPTVMVLSSAPWIIAAGLLGPLAATILAFLSGILTALWETHNLYTPMALAFIAMVYSVAVRQSYRTLFYRLLRHPLITSLILTLLYPVLHLIITPAFIQGTIINQLDYAISNLGGLSITIGMELLLGGLIAELIKLKLPNLWQEPITLIPSPSEQSLNARFLVSLSPLGFVLVLVLIIGSWIVSGKVARDSIQSEMANAAELAAENIPYFFETGQNQIQLIASDPEIWIEDEIELNNQLQEYVQSVPFFNQLSILDKTGKLLVSYPTSYYLAENAPAAEQMGIQLALSGVPFQTYTVPGTNLQESAQISFIATIFDENEAIKGVLVGRANPIDNPITKPIIASLNKFTGKNGIGFLLDEDKHIVYHTNPSMVMTTYMGELSKLPSFYENMSSDGTRMLYYYQPAIGRAWSVILGIPSYRAQQLALSIATPLVGMIIFLSLIAIVLLRLSINAVTGSLVNLAGEADRLSQMQLETPLQVEGVDEVGKLRYAFEKMRINLKDRLEELNRLLIVSQGVASSLEITNAVQPVLEAALATGANAARIVITPTIVPSIEGDSDHPICFGLGRSQEKYKELDDQILALTRQIERLVLPNLLRPRLINFLSGSIRPESVIALALRNEDDYYGSLWIAFDEPHIFTEEEVRFLVTLSRHATLAIMNARLFMNSEIRRQQLSAILSSSPDPILVTDQSDCLLLANPAAWQVLEFSVDTEEGTPVDQILKQPELIDLLLSNSDDEQSIELTFETGNTYLAAATRVQTEGQLVGRVCVLRDITHFKELDALKSEFVSTVSHDLRSPLTLMRGYATMLEMVGQLNEKQQNYVRMIVDGVENMSHLVNSLLDLGRIDAGIGLKLEMASLEEIIEKVIGALQLQATQKNIQLTTDIPDTIPLIEVDQALIQQAIQNLTENAVKYTRPEGKVHIQVSEQPIGIQVSVADTGIGVSPMDQPRLFERFFRGGHQNSPDDRGTGLGLTIVKSIADRHRGKVWVESHLGKGSTFYFSIPKSQSSMIAGIEEEAEFEQKGKKPAIDPQVE